MIKYLLKITTMRCMVVNQKEINDLDLSLSTYIPTLCMYFLEHVSIIVQISYTQFDPTSSENHMFSAQAVSRMQEFGYETLPRICRKSIVLQGTPLIFANAIFSRLVHPTTGIALLFPDLGA